jgi:hypothetical protein
VGREIAEGKDRIKVRRMSSKKGHRERKRPTRTESPKESRPVWEWKRIGREGAPHLGSGLELEARQADSKEGSSGCAQRAEVEWVG